MKNYFFILVLIVINVFYSNNYSNNDGLNCFTVVVGKNVSEDGSVLVAHNEDDWGKQIVNLYKVPSLNHAQNEKVTFFNGGKLNQFEKTNGFIWIELPGMKVADSFVNEKGVVVTSNGCPSREENPDSTDGGILYWLRRLVAERANSSKEAVKIAGNLINKYGYVSSGRTYTFADRNEAWIFSAVYGKHWIAQRVPDNEVVVIPNYYTIGEIDLLDTLNFLGSEDIIDHAIKNNWYNPEDRKDFNFAKAYTALTSIKHPGNIDRIWRGISLLSEKSYPIDQDLPFSFKPYKKLNVQDLKNVLRDHYELCELDKSGMYKNGNPHETNNATICSGSSQYSFVIQLREKIPVEVGTLIWFTYYRPGVNIYTPIYLGTESIPNEFAFDDYNAAIMTHFDPEESTFVESNNHVYWDCVNAVRKVDENFSMNFPIITNENKFIENNLIKENKLFDQEIIKDFNKNPKNTIKKITDYSNKNLELIRKRAQEISNQD
ncbi:MAG: C69 family dipeptidase [Ignavibacteriales bacterium]|nr:C69 family dipeptidase [Ignavibacteriales bacterium]